MSRSERFSNQMRNFPAPGTYTIPSPNKLPGGALDKSKRPSIADPQNHYPGPGTYTITSTPPPTLPTLKDAISRPRKHLALNTPFVSEDCYDTPSFYESHATGFNTTAKSQLSQLASPYVLKRRQRSRSKGFATDHRKTQTRRASLDRTQRFGPRFINTPGPGRYNPRVPGKSLVKSLGKSARVTIVCETLSPGPGAYHCSYGKSGKHYSLYERRESDRQAVGRGPGECDERVVMPKAPRAVFGTTKRQGVQILNDNPGPGSYGKTESFTLQLKHQSIAQHRPVAQHRPAVLHQSIDDEYSFDEFS